VKQQLAKLQGMLREVVNQPIHVLPFLQPGRLVRVKDGDTDWGPLRLCSSCILFFCFISFPPDRSSLQAGEWC
jgi:hypothetical protein